MAERSGVSREIGEALLRRQRRLFRWWHRVQDGTLARSDLTRSVDVCADPRGGADQQCRRSRSGSFGATGIAPSGDLAAYPFWLPVQGGSQFVSQMLTVVTSLKAQHRNVLDFLSQAGAATRLNQRSPSLLPQAESQQDAPLTDHHEPLSLA